MCTNHAVAGDSSTHPCGNIESHAYLVGWPSAISKLRLHLRRPAVLHVSVSDRSSHGFMHCLLFSKAELWSSAPLLRLLLFWITDLRTYTTSGIGGEGNALELPDVCTYVHLLQRSRRRGVRPAEKQQRAVALPSFSYKLARPIHHYATRILRLQPGTERL
jgi:hypothetical protein